MGRIKEALKDSVGINAFHRGVQKTREHESIYGHQDRPQEILAGSLGAVLQVAEPNTFHLMEKTDENRFSSLKKVVVTYGVDTVIGVLTIVGATSGQPEVAAAAVTGKLVYNAASSIRIQRSEGQPPASDGSSGISTNQTTVYDATGPDIAEQNLVQSKVREIISSTT